MLSSFAARTIAVTGAAGFLGASVVARLARSECTIIRIARGPCPPLAAPAATIVDVCGDVRERGTWDRLADADVVFHFAAQTGAAAAAVDPDADFTANVMPMRHLLAACREGERRPTVLFAGTVTQAGIPSRVPVDELVPDEPVTSYDRHKLMAEADLKLAAAAGVVSGTSLRLANVYGPGARGGKADRDVLNRMIGAALRGEPLTVYGTGEHMRDYVFIEDVVDAFLAAASRPERVNGRHYVIGSGQGISIRGAFELVAARVALRTGVRASVLTVDPAAPLSPIDQRDFVADPSRFSSDTGWRPSVGLSDGIDRTIEAMA